MGPRKAAEQFRNKTPDASGYRVTLFGSLAATGAGHLTDKAILEELTPQAKTDIIWKPDVFLPFHPNAMLLEALDKDGNVTESDTVYSIGGGDIVHDGESRSGSDEQVYDMNTISEILKWCEETGRSFWEYVDICEGPDIWNYLREVWKVMKEAVERGIEAEGVLPGGLGLRRKAVSYYVHATGYNPSLKSRGLVYAYALAVSEENASGGMIVTAPTCGSCGIVPASSLHFKRVFRTTHSESSCHSRAIWQCCQTQCFGVRCRSRMPGRSRCRMRYGSSCRITTFRRHTGSDRIFCGDGTGASSRIDL